MKKIFSALVFTSLCIALALPVLAQTTVPESCTINQAITVQGTDCPASCPFTNTICGMCCLLNTIYNITNWIFFILIAIAIIFIILGGFMFVTAGGNAERTITARQYLMYAAIGILVGLLAKAIPALVKMLTGMS